VHQEGKVNDQNIGGSEDGENVVKKKEMGKR